MKISNLKRGKGGSGPYSTPLSESIPVLLDGSLCDSFRLPEVEEEELDWDD